MKPTKRLKLVLFKIHMFKPILPQVPKIKKFSMVQLLALPWLKLGVITKMISKLQK